MRTIIPLFQTGLLIGILSLSASPLLAQDAELIRHFDYDQKAALVVKEISVEHRGSTAIYDITYDSPKGGRVPAYLVVPYG